MADVIFPTGIPNGTIDSADIIMFSDVSASNATKDCTVASLPVSTATQTALDTKQDTLVSGTNIKTINGATVLGSGDLTVVGTPGTPASTVTNETTYGITPSVGTGTDYARNDHTHGTPATTKDKTAITGLLKGDGTDVSAAISGTDYLTPSGSGASLTGITGVQVANTPAGNIAATTVQGAINELDTDKVNYADLTSSFTLYPTTVASDIATYSVLVTSLDAVDYNDVAVDISTGTITTTDQFIAALASSANVLIGNPGVINISTIGNIKRVSGSANASFFFRVYHRTSAGVETLVATSNATLEVTSASYIQFSSSALLNNGTWLSTDRIVIKFYGTNVGGGSDPVYNFQFGGSLPVRTNFPVPVSVLPSDLTLQNVGSLINTATEKTTPVDADMVALMDSEASNIVKKLSWTNIKATLKTYFDSLYLATVAPSTSGNVLTSNGTAWVSSAPSGGGSAQIAPIQDYQGPAIIGVLGTFVFDASKTISKCSITVDTIPVGSNYIVELRKNSYTSGNILPSVLQVATTDTLTNGKKTVSVSLTTANTVVSGDYVVIYVTSVGSTTPAMNGLATITFA